MSLEDDIITMRNEIQDLTDTFQDLNQVMGKSVTAFGGQLTKTAKAAQANTAATQQQTQATQQQTQATQQQTAAQKRQTAAQAQAEQALKEFNRTQRDNRNFARELARAQLDAEKQARSFAGRLDAAAGASVENQRALIIWSERAKKAGDVLAGIGTGGSRFVKSLAEGDTKFTSLNPLIDSTTSALGELAKTVPYAGNFIAGSFKLLGEATKFLLGQLQTATETFQQVSQAGGLTGQGMSGLLEQIQKSGMTLEGFRRAITENSRDLAAFGGTVGSGAEKFSQITQQIIDSDVGLYLRRLGLTADEMGTSTARFIGIQQRLGLAQGRSFQQLASGAAAYMKELDLLARITGQNREESQKRLDAMLVENRFQAELADLAAQGRHREVEQLKLAALALDAGNKELGQAFRATVGGIMNDDMSRAFNTVGVNVLKFSEDIKYNGKSYVDVLMDAQAQVKRAEPSIISLGRVLDNTTKVIPNVRDALDFSRRDINAMAAAAMQNEGQTDELTKSAAEAQRSMEQMSRQMAALIRTTLPNFGKAVAGVTDVLNDTLKKLGLPAVTGGPGPGGGAGASRAEPRPGGRREQQGPGGGSAAGIGGAGMAATGATPSMVKIREMIAKVESSGGNYNVLAGGDTANLTSMTVQQVMELQKKRLADKKPHAAGKYQIQLLTMRDIMGAAGVGLGDMFNETTQDKLADALIRRRGYEQYAQNPTPEAKARFLANLAQEWRGLPNAPGVVKGQPTDRFGNKAGMDWGEAIEMFQRGGVFRRSQGLAMLHGPEAVVPLPDGRSIPVEIKQPLSGLTSAIAEVMQTINDQKQSMQQISSTGTPKVNQEMVDVLKQSVATQQFNNQLVDSLVSLQRENNSLNERILRASNN